MSNDHHGDMLLSKILDNLQDLTGQFWIKCRCRFIKKQDLRIHTERTGNGNSLLLSSGKLKRICLLLVCKAHFLKKASCLGVNLIFLSLLHLQRCIHYIFQYRKMRKQIELLEHQSHITVFDDLTAVRRLKSCGTTQDG